MHEIIDTEFQQQPFSGFLCRFCYTFYSFIKMLQQQAAWKMKNIVLRNTYNAAPISNMVRTVYIYTSQKGLGTLPKRQIPLDIGRVAAANSKKNWVTLLLKYPVQLNTFSSGDLNERYQALYVSLKKTSKTIVNPIYSMVAKHNIISPQHSNFTSVTIYQ